jgi:aspartyl protease family protein
MIKNAIFVGTVIGIAFGVPVFYLSNSNMNQALRHNSQSEQIAYVAEPQQKTAKAPALSGAAVAIAMDERGHFQSDFKLNGRKVQALIDTGATYVAINKTMASRIGIKITAKDMKYKVSTANGEASAAAVLIHDVSIGKIRVYDVEALVMEDKALDGVLMGMSFLKQLDKFTVENQTLVLKQ